MSASTSPKSEGGAPATESFDFGEWRGEVVAAYRPLDLEAEISRLADPAAAVETLHWGRNYLYRARLATAAGPLEVAVKQFVNEGWKRRWKRRFGGSKAQRSWRAARALLAAGVATPEPVLLVESKRAGGPSLYVCRHLGGLLEARYLLREANAGASPAEIAERFPGADLDRFLAALAATLRRMHDAGLQHRDMSSGNVLIDWRPDAAPPELYVLDLNRTKLRRRLTTPQRMRDLSRMMIHRREHQRRFLDLYRRGDAGAVARTLYLVAHHGFRFKNDAKKAIRRRLHRLTQTAKDLVLPRGAHAHIPRAPEGVSTRERVVWDHLSDQPHLHAGKLVKLGTRLRDSPAWARQLAAAAGAWPAVRARCRRRVAERWRRPVPFAGLGVALRPYPENPGALLAAVDDLAVHHLLLRLHPWQGDHGAEEALARALAERGHDLAFALPQNRMLVRDPGHWRAAVEELAERFAPFGRTFVVGQAPNRSKWGVWQPREYRALAQVAAEVLRRHDGVRVLGPGVIDFEPLATLGLLHYPGMPTFDALASLLYVDRRGAPEAVQMGYDAAGKAALMAAVADGATATGGSWITEFNWPLREGPHAPAGKLVAVDEETQADYLVRCYLAFLAAGDAERAYWWQLAARGYGLTCPEDGGGLRRRPSYQALRLLREMTAATSCEGRLEGMAEGARGLRFRRADGGVTVVGWAVGGGDVEVRLGGRVEEAVDRGGRRLVAKQTVRLGGAPVWFRLAAE